MYSPEQKQPTAYTVEKNRVVAETLGIDLQNAENEELILAKSHCLRELPDLKLKNSSGQELWDLSRQDYVNKKEVPDSVNPSLWVQTRCLYETGIYSVVGRDIIQARGFDVANISFVRGKTGWIVVDTGSTVEGAEAAVRETENALGEKIRGNIKAVIISHSHSDHFGGIAGVVSPEEVGKPEDGKIPVYVAKGFDEAARDEYVYAGAAMGRRSNYQVGANVPRDEKGKVSIGCGFATVPGTNSYISPTNYISEDVTLIIDGITVDFQLANETEAVANMQNYFHEYKALWVADDCIGTLHNICTMRGAKIRDAKRWADVLYDAYVRYGSQAQVIFQGHAHPHWNTEAKPNEVGDVLLYHAAAYQFIHDQSLLYLNQGYTDREIAKKLKIPQALADKWYLRPYYGDYEFNARAVYTNYVGFYDGNPIHLKPSTPEDEAKQFIEYVGSEEAVLKKAKKDYDQGNYQLAAEAANKVVFVNPQNKDARYLCADALEQLGYQSESAIFRNAYLQGAYELRNQPEDTSSSVVKTDIVLQGMENEQIIEYLGMVLDSDRLGNLHKKLLLNVDKESTDEYFLVEIAGGALLKKRLSGGEEEVRRYTSGTGLKTVSITREQLIRFIAADASVTETFAGEEQAFWQQLQGAIVNIEAFKQFHIVEP